MFCGRVVRGLKNTQIIKHLRFSMPMYDIYTFKPHIQTTHSNHTFKHSQLEAVKFHLATHG